jgi:hypothetical protein
MEENVFPKILCNLEIYQKSVFRSLVIPKDTLGPDCVSPVAAWDEKNPVSNNIKI